jgi:hypothetical protein
MAVRLPLDTYPVASAFQTIIPGAMFIRDFR